ncbi:MAG: hypothetical protein J6T68_01415 [Candidatus Methanomethylophilaceae archaeon]|nr:hypothetical protein [Candidatus Methanomethylophilaceae archaeon]
MNIGTSDVVTIYNKSTSSSANVSSSGAVSKSVGDLSADVVGSLYKKNAQGEFEPVKFFKNKESMMNDDGESVEWLAEYSLNVMEKCGKFLHLLYGKQKGGTYIYELFVNTETGKIYQVHEGYNSHYYAFSMFNDDNSSNDPMYHYCGIYKGLPLFYKDDDKYATYYNFGSMCTFDIQDDNLVISELFNKEQFSDVKDDVKVYKNDVIEFRLAGSSETYYRFSDGTFSNSSVLKAAERQVCDGYLCHDVIKDSNGFVTTYKKYTTNKDNFETVNPTDAEKFRIASEEDYPNQVFRYKDGDNTVILRLYKMCDFEKITIRPDLTKGVEEWSISREIKIANHDNKSEPIPDYYHVRTYENMMYYWSDVPTYLSKVNVGFNDNFMFIPGTDRIVAYDLTSNLSFNEGTVVLSDLINIKDMYYKDGHVIVTGVKSNGQTFYATFESDGTVNELASDVILKETVILPLN